jgi:hypothetical protein
MLHLAYILPGASPSMAGKTLLSVGAGILFLIGIAFGYGIL